MKGALDLHRALLADGVQHEIVRLPRPILSADELPDALALSPRRCVVVRSYVVDAEQVAVLTLCDDVPSPGAVLTAAAGRVLRPATAGEVNAHTDYAAGLVGPLLPAGMTVLADEAVGAAGVLYTPTGDSGTALGIEGADLLRLSGARTAELCRRDPTESLLDEDLDAELARLPAHPWR